MKVYVVQDESGVLEGVFSSEENARAAFPHWRRLELREAFLDRGTPEYPFSSPLKPEDITSDQQMRLARRIQDLQNSDYPEHEKLGNSLDFCTVCGRVGLECDGKAKKRS